MAASNIPSTSLAYPFLSCLGYTATVRKTTIVIDDEKLQRVESILGTDGLTETVNEAFERVIRNQALEGLFQMSDEGMFELTNEEIEASDERELDDSRGEAQAV
jgi:Arc/MetJ family transcription regulator